MQHVESLPDYKDAVSGSYLTNSCLSISGSTNITSVFWFLDAVISCWYRNTSSCILFEKGKGQHSNSLKSTMREIKVWYLCCSSCFAVLVFVCFVFSPAHSVVCSFVVCFSSVTLPTFGIVSLMQQNYGNKGNMLFVINSRYFLCRTCMPASEDMCPTLDCGRWSLKKP